MATWIFLASREIFFGFSRFLAARAGQKSFARALRSMADPSVAFEWIELRTPATRTPATPRRPSQIVHETSVATPQGQNIIVTLERTSTGGTQREAAFKRAAGGAMSEAERAQKKRVRASLFPDRQAAGRKRHADLERTARPKRKEKELQESIERYDRLEEFCRQRGVTQADADYEEFDRLESERECMMRRVRKTRK